jgi:hypothetical protein
VRLEGLGKLKKIHLIGTRTLDLPACSIVPQPTTLNDLLTLGLFNDTFQLRWLDSFKWKNYYE